MSTVKVGLVQMSCGADKEANLQKAIERVREVATKGAQIVCLQELFTSLYFCDVEDYENFRIDNRKGEYSPNLIGNILTKYSGSIGITECNVSYL